MLLIIVVSQAQAVYKNKILGNKFNLKTTVKRKTFSSRDVLNYVHLQMESDFLLPYTLDIAKVITLVNVNL